MKGFLVLLMGALVLGGGLGGAFAGGVALGKSQGNGLATGGSPSPIASRVGQEAPGQSDQALQDRFQRRSQPGGLDRQGRDRPRQESAGQRGATAGGHGFSHRAGLMGIVEKVEDSTVMVNTPRGRLQATVGADTSIRRLAQGSVADLPTGAWVKVAGQRVGDGAVEARWILVIPELKGSSANP